MNDYLDHVRQLAHDSGVKVWASLDGLGEWGVALLDGSEEPTVLLGEVPTTLEPYMIALHEIGHHIDPDWGRGLKLDREVFAWWWAFRVSLAWDWAVVLTHLTEYARDRRYRRTPDFEDLIQKATDSALSTL